MIFYRDVTAFHQVPLTPAPLFSVTQHDEKRLHQPTPKRDAINEQPQGGFVFGAAFFSFGSWLTNSFEEDCF